MSLWIHVFEFFRHIPRGGIAGSYGNSILKFLRNCQTALHYQEQWMRVPFSPQPLKHLSLLVLLIIAIVTVVRWYLVVVLICFCLIASEVDYLFIYLFAICMSSGERCFFRSSACFLIGLFVWCWVLWVLYIFWILNLCWSCCLQILTHIWSFASLFCGRFPCCVEAF